MSVHPPVPLAPSFLSKVIACQIKLQSASKPGCIGGGFARGPRMDRLLINLRESDVAVKLIKGSEELNRIYEYVHLVLAALFLGPRPVTLKDSLRLLAFNLDWYIHPPRRLLRAEWILMLIAMALMGVYLVFIALTIATQLRMFLNVVGLGWPVIVAIWLSAYGDKRRYLQITALMRYLGELGLDGRGEVEMTAELTSPGTEDR